MNPYRILGVPDYASEDEVRKAYRSLAFAYHPDRFAGTPQQHQAEKRMALINAAYAEIKARGFGGKSGGGAACGGYGPVEDYVRMGQIQRALEALEAMERRDGYWYFTAARCYQSRGWNMRAIRCMEQACAMEPDNREYRAKLTLMRLRERDAARLQAQRHRQDAGLADRLLRNLIYPKKR
nr:J domain-containing protein [bacterium]